MTSARPRQSVDTVLMRGGTSRGPVLLSESLPHDPAARDAAVVRLVGGEQVQTDGLGGGGPTTSKVVVVKPVQDHKSGLVLDYSVGNIVVGQHAVDWSGTCGNMTAAVPLYALEEHLIPATWEGPLRLRNTSTDRLVETSISGMRLHRPGEEAVVTTRYLDPAGAVLRDLLPTGTSLDHIKVGLRTYQASLIDVTHPYLFLLYDEVVGGGDLRDTRILTLIETLRGEMCVRLGLAASRDGAGHSSPAVPRVVLVHRTEGGDGVKINAISMGQPIASIPVTAAMCLAAACHIPGTVLPRRAAGDSHAGSLTVTSPGACLSAAAVVDADGAVASVAVDRTARTIMRGTAWI